MVIPNSARLLRAAALVLLAIPLGRWGWDRLSTLRPALTPRGPHRPAAPEIWLTPAHSPCAAALREARADWIRAGQRAARALEHRLQMEPTGVLGRYTAAYRQRLMALDPGGDLRRAPAAALRAAALARTPAETYEAAAVQAQIDCDAGNHAEELRQARRMVALRPLVWASWETLKHAAVCNGLRRLAAHPDRVLSSMRVTCSNGPRSAASAYRPPPPLTAAGSGRALGSRGNMPRLLHLPSRPLPELRPA